MSSKSSYTLRGSTNNLKRRRSTTVDQFCGECIIYKDTSATTTCEDYAQQLLLQSNSNNNNNNNQKQHTKIIVSTIEEARLLVLDEHKICSTFNNNNNNNNSGDNKADKLLLNEAITINNNNEQPPSSTSSTNINTTSKTMIKTTTHRRKLQAPSLPPSAFCNTCMWQEGTPYTCSERSTFLQDNYELTSDEAMVGLMDQGYCVDPNYFDRVAAEKLAKEQAEVQKLLEEQNKGSGGGGSGAAIGGAIVGILVVVALVVGVLLVRKRRKTNATENCTDGSGNKKGDATKDVSDNEYEQDPENQLEYAPAGAAVEIIPSTNPGSGTPETAPMGSVSDVSPKTGNTLRGAAAGGGDDPSTSGGSTGSGTSAQILKKLKDLRNRAPSRRASLDDTPTHENTKKEEEMSRKELLELLKKERERVCEAAPPSSKSAAAPPPVADPEEASVEIWIECDNENQTCAQSVLTWDVDDDWSGMTPKYKPDPTGDTNHVEQLPSMNEMESQEDSYPSRSDDNNSGRYAPGVKYGLKSDPDDASQEKNNKRGFIPRRLSTSAKKNPSWFKNNNQGGSGDDDDDSTFRGSGGSKATMAQALNPKAMQKAKDIKYPQGDVTIIYTDVQASTSFWETCPSDMKTATDIHDKIMRQCYTDHQGYEITTEGDAFNLAFQHPADALAFALQAQIKLYKADWPEGILKHPDGKDEPALKLRGFRVRFGLHHGPTTSRVHEMTGRMVYYGEGVKLAKTVEGMCHGGQILTTMETWKAVSGMAERYLGRPQILDCGEHLLFERTNLIGPNAGKTTTRHTKRIMQLVPSELAFDFFEARGRRDVPSKDGTGYEVKDASKVSGRQFPPLISKKLLTTSFIDAPYENGTVTICFVYTIGLKDDNPDKRSKNLGVLAKYVRTELLALSPPGYECQEDNGCWMLAFDRMVHAVSFGLRLKSTVGRATDLVGNVDKENMFKVGIVSGPFTSMGPHKTTGMADYFGPIVNRAARVASNCQPGQVCIGMPLSNGSSVLESSDRQFQDLDASEREMNSNVDHDKTTIPRELADEEIASLRMMLKKKLHICNEDHAADADDLLDYAIEMIEEGKSVGYVTVELNLMEMEVFPHEVSDGFGKCMSTFLLGLSEEDMSNGMIEGKNDENDDLKIDLGPKINVRLQGIKKLKGIAIDVAIFACSKKE